MTHITIGCAEHRRGPGDAPSEGGAAAKNKTVVSPKDQAWIEARRRHRLSHLHVQMARELDLNPKKLGSIDNHDQEPWKTPLPEFVEQLHRRRFGRGRPAVVLSIEERARQAARKNAERRAARAARRADGAADETPA